MEMLKIRYRYSCDGGINPKHHYPRSVWVETDPENKLFTLTTGSGIYRHNGKPVDSKSTLAECEAILKDQYDRITLESVVVLKVKDLKMTIKWEQSAQ